MPKMNLPSHEKQAMKFWKQENDIKIMTIIHISTKYTTTSKLTNNLDFDSQQVVTLKHPFYIF